MSKMKFIIKKLDIKRSGAIVTQWTKANAPLDDIHTILLWMQTPNCSCLSVENEKGDVYALFDIIEAPAHIKQMKVCFSPKYNFALAEQDVQEFKEILERFVLVLKEIFNYVVHLSEKWGLVKIFNNDIHIGMIFAIFANELRQMSPAYKVKSYKAFGSWVEIRNPAGTRGKGGGR
jgi:hypothetical protein